MAQIKNIYLGNLRTQAEHLKSGDKILTDAPVDNNGKGEAFSPTDLVCAALASCMMTVMGMVATREGFELEGTSTEVIKVMTSEPRRKISEIHIKFSFPTSLVLSDKQKEVLKRAAHTCPVGLSLHPEIKQHIEFDY